MPTTITALLIITIAVFPGLIGDRVYQFIVGVDWREKEFRTILRLIGFSVIGVVIYSIAHSIIGFVAAEANSRMRPVAKRFVCRPTTAAKIHLLFGLDGFSV